MRLVDSLFSAIGRPRRVPGAAYSDEWWGDIPAAAPQAVFEGVRLPELNRVATELLQDVPGSRVTTPAPLKAPTPVPLKAVPAPHAEAAPAELDETDWEGLIAAAKNRANDASRAAEPDEEDWDRLLLAAKCRAG